MSPNPIPEIPTVLRAVPDGASPGVLRLELGERQIGRWYREGRDGDRFELEENGVDRKRRFIVSNDARFGERFALNEQGDAQDAPLVEVASAHRPDSLAPTLEIHRAPSDDDPVTLEERLYLKRAELWGERRVLTDDVKSWGSFQPKDLQSHCPTAELDPLLPLPLGVFALILVANS